MAHGWMGLWGHSFGSSFQVNPVPKKEQEGRYAQKSGALPRGGLAPGEDRPLLFPNGLAILPDWRRSARWRVAWVGMPKGLQAWPMADRWDSRGKRKRKHCFISLFFDPKPGRRPGKGIRLVPCAGTKLIGFFKNTPSPKKNRTKRFLSNRGQMEQTAARKRQGGTVAIVNRAALPFKS